MMRLIRIVNGKKYLVNAPGWNDDVGSSTQLGHMWLQSNDGNWYDVSLQGSSGSVSININPTPLNWASPGQDFPYQLLFDQSNSKVYQVYLTGTGAGTTLNVSQSAYPNSSSYKPYMLLQSTDSRFYPVYVSGTGPITIQVNQNGGVNMYPAPTTGPI